MGKVSFKFGVPNNAKVGQKGRCLRHVTYFYNSVSSTTSMERLNVQTSNLMRRLLTRGTIQEIQKLDQVGTWPRSRDLLSNFGIPFTSLKWVELET